MSVNVYRYSPQPTNEPWFLRRLAERIYKERGHMTDGQQDAVRIKRIADMLEALIEDEGK